MGSCSASECWGTMGWASSSKNYYTNLAQNFEGEISSKAVTWEIEWEIQWWYKNGCYWNKLGVIYKYKVRWKEVKSSRVSCCLSKGEDWLGELCITNVGNVIHTQNLRRQLDSGPDDVRFWWNGMWKCEPNSAGPGNILVVGFCKHSGFIKS
jgi:hypothetical protein